MLNLGSTEWLLVLSAFAGAMHVAAPDHWIPASLVSWQGGWRFGKTLAFAALALLLHTLMGFFIYYVALDLLERTGWLEQIGEPRLFIAGIGFVLVTAVFRWVRFSRRRELIRLGAQRIWGMVSVFSLLGPCESIVPVFLKARELGIGYLTPFVAFLVGTLAAGVALVLVGRMVWNRPILLPRGMALAHHRALVIPVIAGVTLGLTALLRV